MWLGIRFATKNPTSHAKAKEEILKEEINLDAGESDRKFSAILSAGTKFGSRQQLEIIQQAENLLMEKAREFNVQKWLGADVGQEDEDEDDPAPFFNDFDPSHVECRIIRLTRTQFLWNYHKT